MKLTLRAVSAVAILGVSAGLLMADTTPATAKFADYGPTHPGMMNAWGYVGTSAPPYGPGLDASLYPCPRPDIPYNVGATIITNPAFDPHEMLYPHAYRGVYGPYYFKKGCLTNSGYVIGTEVRVKYHGHYTLFSGFFPPRRPSCSSGHSWNK